MICRAAKLSVVVKLYQHIGGLTTKKCVNLPLIQAFLALGLLLGGGGLSYVKAVQL